MTVIYYIWLLVQVFIGIHLVIPSIFYFLWKLQIFKTSNPKYPDVEGSYDYAIIVTAYEYIDTIPAVISSLLKLDHSQYVIYVVADNCNIETLQYEDPRIKILRPPVTLASNTKSHSFAIDNFIRNHDIITIIDSDNLVEPDYLSNLDLMFHGGFDAVQGIRKAKNFSTTLSSLDAARDFYYHFFDGKVLFQIGSSATLSGSGMAFKEVIYVQFLRENQVSGAGFDKVLQNWLLKNQVRIAFAEDAIVYDEKTSRSDQLVKQRSRWINTWFKYFALGFNLIFLGVKNLNRNQFLFGIVTVRPPLFMFLIFSIFAFIINLAFGYLTAAFCWLISIALFQMFFFIALREMNTDKRVYKSLLSAPVFIFYQILALLKVRRANKISVATRHYQSDAEKQNIKHS